MGPGSHLLAAAGAPAWLEEPPFQTAASGQAASGGTRWRSRFLAAQEGKQSGRSHRAKSPPGSGTGDPRLRLAALGNSGLYVALPTEPAGLAKASVPILRPRPAAPSRPPSDPGVFTSPIFCTRVSVVHPEYVVLSTAGSRYGGELQIRRQTRCVWPLPGTRKGEERMAAGTPNKDPSQQQQ